MNSSQEQCLRLGSEVKNQMKIKCIKAECPQCHIVGSIQLFLNKQNEVKYARTRHYVKLDPITKKPQFEYHKVEDLEALKTLLKSQSISLSTDKAKIGQVGQSQERKIHDLKLNNSSLVEREISVPRWPSLVGRYLGKVMVAGSKPARGSNFALTALVYNSLDIVVLCFRGF